MKLVTDIRKELEATMRPIYLKLSKPADKLPTGSSRFWGNPDLPAGTGYPTYTADDGEKYHYEFICQINLSDVASLDRDGLLPCKGLLSFFAKIGYYMGDMDNVPGIGGYVSDAGDVSVLYFPEVDDTFHEAVLVDEDGRQVNPDELRIDFAHSREPYDSEHALLAPPVHREWETWNPPYEDWQILLQIDSDEGDDFSLNFMDWGVLDFLIAPDDLCNRCFDNVRAIVLST